MTPPATDWGGPIAILAAGLIIGAMFVFFFKRRKAATVDVNLERKDLEARRDALIAQLRALPDDAVEERERLERDTADVLRALDKQPAPRTSNPEPRTPNPINPTIKGFLWGAGSIAILAVLLYFVMQSSTPRNETNAPATLQDLEAAVQKDPDNLALRDNLAQAYLENNNPMGAFEQAKFVLARNPNDARALTYQAYVLMQIGQSDIATNLLQRAVRSDPTNIEGYVNLAWVYVQTNKMKEADETIASAALLAPNDRPRLQQLLQQMKMSTQQAGSQLPEGHPPIDGVPSAAAPVPSPAPAPASSGKSVRVTLNLEAPAPPHGVLFVIARNPAGGPPYAVKRIEASGFPITIDIGQADSMMGQQIPDSFRLEARLDSDGDPLTKPPTDPQAAVDNVAPGAVITLSLK